MKKIILAGLTAGIAITIWQFAAWMVLPLHKDTIKPTPNEEAVTTVLSNSITEEGVYGLPNAPKQRNNPEEMKQWEEKFRRGPLATIFYRPTGDNPAMTSQFIIRFIIQIIAAMIAAWLLSRSTAASQSYISRVCFVGVLGIFASIVTHVSFWNWMYFPLKYTTAMMADLIIGWIIGGLVIAAFIKPVTEAK
ncbi:MAG: hypothetical protein KKF20_01085 [Bacteroidetes bacterium]|nr:hypothetical protein [Bacteroidota bacterium]MBU1423349.1 hypothetical protein [Bacteroidota bacterium]MBU2470987.1 hypothetical protein [Bacteroidota bacterium]MBU2635707.1 hypothetical protein [Bacteroidota bacterium]